MTKDLVTCICGCPDISAEGASAQGVYLDFGNAWTALSRLRRRPPVPGQGTVSRGTLRRSQGPRGPWVLSAGGI